MVPGSILIYGSNFCIVTEKPRAFNKRPNDAAVIPFPSPETTPPVTNTYFTGIISSILPGCGCKKLLLKIHKNKYPAAQNKTLPGQII